MKMAQRPIQLDERSRGLIVPPDQLVLPVQLSVTENTATAANTRLAALRQSLAEASQACWEPERQGFVLEKRVGSGVFGGGASRRVVARRTGALVVAVATEADFGARVERAARLLDAVAPLEGSEVGLGAVTWRHANPSALRERVLEGLREEASAIATRMGLPLTRLETEGQLKVEVLGPMQLRISLPCALRFGSDES